MKTSLNKISARTYLIKYLFLVFIPAVILTASCKKNFLEQIPDDRVSGEIYWKTANDALLGANAVYTYLDGVDIFRWDGLTDIGHTNITFSNEAPIEKGIHDALNTVIYNYWTNAYKGIRSANDFLLNVDKVTTTDQALINRLKAEVRVLRAYQYIKLAAYYGDVPLVTGVISLEESQSIKRTPVAQVWDFVAQELNATAKDLPLVQKDKGRITKGAALALLARGMLYAGRYQEAAAAAKQVMDLKTYSLYPAYKNLFSYQAENNAEVILDKEFLVSTYSNNVFALMAPRSQLNSGNNFIPTKKMVDAYQMTNGKDISDPASGFDPFNPYKSRDPRLGYSVFLLGDKLPNGKIFDPRPGSGTVDAVDNSFNAPSTGFVVEKYINPEDLAQPANCGINIILLRYAEVLLTYAEAKIEANQIDQSVLNAINLVRARPDVNMPPYTTLGSQSLMREIVRRERLTELAFEGLRFVDIRRWRIAENVMPGQVLGMTYIDKGTLKTIRVPAFDKTFNKNRDYLLPIPQKEIEINRNLVQNPGW
ncbi:MAG: RagB/SusD family nutrient uptake outer membrane protein [Daejeonella sp.]